MPGVSIGRQQGLGLSPRVLIEAVEGRKRDTPTWAGSTATPDFPFDPDLLRHVSPIEWKNVILYGEIKIDPAKLKLREP